MNRLRGNRGFSLIELMVVLTIMSVLVRLSMPAMATYRRHAVTAKALNDFNVVRSAAYAQFEATGVFPPEAAAGAMPQGSAQFLPRGFSFTRAEYELDWDHVTITDSTNTPGYVTMLTVVVPDSLLGHSMIRKLGASTTHWSVGNAHTFVVASSSGQ